jgi:hypothetical protein
VRDPALRRRSLCMMSSGLRAAFAAAVRCILGGGGAHVQKAGFRKMGSADDIIAG